MLCCPHCPPAMLYCPPVTPSSSYAVLSSQFSSYAVLSSLSSSDAVLSSLSSSDAVLSSLSSSDAVLSSLSSSDAMLQRGGSLLTSPVWCSPPHSPNGLPQEKAQPEWLTDFSQTFGRVADIQQYLIHRSLPYFVGSPTSLCVCVL